MFCSSGILNGTIYLRKMSNLILKDGSPEAVKSLILNEDGVNHLAIIALRSAVRKLSEEERELIMASDPNPKWIKRHPTITVQRTNPATGLKESAQLEYIPIDKIETLLDIFYLRKSIQVVEQGQLFNAVYVKVRVRVFDPTINDWIEHDGVGACEVQTKRGASAADMSAIVNGAVQKALPAAKSYAIKDATDHLGNIFGRNVGRENTIDATMIMKSEGAMLKDLSKQASIKEQKDFIESATSKEALETIKPSLLKELEEFYNQKLQTLP